MKILPFFFVAAMVLTVPTRAATFCISVQQSTDHGPMQHCETTADANVPYFIAAMSNAYFPQGIMTTPETTPPTFRTPTPQEILDAVGRGIWQGSVNSINSFLATQAAAKAAESAPKVQ